ncbi:MAG: cation-translocating P-type ATPase, partial [Candidatus Rokubacteria bacterium]|nr:cation-translocating P-type ATPase [Candidatus Rokubacteria bacterium]
FAIAAEVLREPMFLLLVACGAIYVVLGDPHEALMLLGFVFLITGVTLYQEHKTERALETLRDLASPRALVIREGRQRRIPGRDVVRDDLFLLEEGDRVPADAIVVSATNLAVDESLLTGESVPVRKTAATGSPAMPPPGGDDLPFVYSGTLVVHGHGLARARETGARTALGKIGTALEALAPEDTPMQAETHRVVRRLAIAGIVFCVVVTIVYAATRGNWLEGVLAGLTLAMAIIPNEFPVVLTLFLSLGAWRLSRAQLLTRRIPAVETLGATTVLCVDKTGTLTVNQMSVAMLAADGRYLALGAQPAGEIPEEFHTLVEFAILASQRDALDPIDQALKRVGDTYLATTEHLHTDWTLVQEYPLSRQLLALSRVWRSPDGQDYVIAAKGAPEAIADLCHFDEGRLRELPASIATMTDHGLRVLGVARARFRPIDLPSQQHDFDFEFLGVVGFEDPVRATAPDAIRECRAAGIRVVIITGDYPATAAHVADQVGLPSRRIVTGAELDAMDDGRLRQRIDSIDVFARVVPEQKLRLVNALKANGEIVAMTGDGVNDAPALRAAHIGLAMGQRGTDVAREAAALVMLDDDFSSLVHGIRQGRRIFDNLAKAMTYILAVHVPIAGLSLLPVVFNWPLILLPIHIAFLHLIIDPACSVVFEAEPAADDVMRRPPRDPREPLFGRRIAVFSLLQGLVTLGVLAGLYGIVLRRGQGELEARALTFTALIVANLGLILGNRSWSRTIVTMLRVGNAALWWVAGGAVMFLSVTLSTRGGRELFRFSPVHADDVVISVVAGLIPVVLFEIFKMARRKSSPVRSR